MEIQKISIPLIILEWSDWTTWNHLEIDARGSKGIRIPNGVSGVYEAKNENFINPDERLYIGKATDLRMRIKQGLVKGKVPHPAGEKIRSKEDVSKVSVRWATTGWPSAAEEALHKKYKNDFGKLPKYVDHT